MMMSNVRGYVKALLTEIKELRDDDRALIVQIYRRAALERYGKPMSLISLAEWLNDFADGKFPSPEGIRRSRALLQQKHPELRGEKYEERQGKIEQEVRAEIKNFLPIKLENRGNGSGLLFPPPCPHAGE